MTTNLLFASVEVGHDIANAGFAALAFVASDPLKQREDFMRAAGRDRSATRPARAST